jgi:hypothetical protein
MADNMIGGGDAKVAQVIISSQQAQQSSQADLDREDRSADAAKKAAQKSLQVKLQAQKSQQLHETFKRGSDSDPLFKAAYSGTLGPDAQRWAQDPQLQNKLSTAQKSLFLQTLASNEAPRARAAAAAIAQLAASPAFANAAPTTQAASEVHDAVLRNPQGADDVGQVLASRVLQSPKADAKLKEDFLRFGLKNAERGAMDSVKAAGDMLGTLANGNTPANGRRASLSMAQRNPDNIGGMENIDGFVQQPKVRDMPDQARGDAVVVLARTDGNGEVRGRLQDVAGDKAFGAMEPQEQARVFSTINLGKTSELRAITDKVLETLRFDSPGFPARQAQIAKLLTEMGQKVTQAGVGSINPRQVIRNARKPGSLEPPGLISMADIDPDDEEALRRARSENQGRVNNFYHELERGYGKLEEKYNRAKYREDVLELGDLPALKPIDTSELGVSEDMRQQVGDDLQNLKKGLVGESRKAGLAAYRAKLSTYRQDLQAKLKRVLKQDEEIFVYNAVRFAEAELRLGEVGAAKSKATMLYRRKPRPSNLRKRRAAASRMTGAQRRYFTSEAGVAAGAVRTTRRNRMPLQAGQLNRVGPERASMGPAANALPGVPGLSGAGRVAQAGSVEQEINKLLTNPELSPVQQMTQAVQLFDEHMQQSLQLGQRIREVFAGQLQEAGAADTQQPVGDAAAAPLGHVGLKRKASGTVQGKTDGWGIQRTFQSDLGARGPAVVRPAGPAAASAASGELDADAAAMPPAQYSGRAIVRGAAAVRDLDTLHGLPWKQLTPSEHAIAVNLGWDLQTWEAKDNPNARLPVSYRTPFNELRPHVQESVRLLGLARDWDRRVAAYTRGGQSE